MKPPLLTKRPNKMEVIAAAPSRTSLHKASHDQQYASSFNTEREMAYQRRQNALNEMQRSSANDVVLPRPNLCSDTEGSLVSSMGGGSSTLLITPSSPLLLEPSSSSGGGLGSKKMFSNMLVPKRVSPAPPPVILTSRTAFSSLHQRRRGESASSTTAPIVNVVDVSLLQQQHTDDDSMDCDNGIQDVQSLRLRHERARKRFEAIQGYYYQQYETHNIDTEGEEDDEPWLADAMELL